MNAREEISAREVLQIMVRTDRGSMTVWGLDEVREALNAHHSEAVAERDAQIIAWLAKKAGEYRSGPNRESAADAIARMADKLSRGAVR